MVSLAFQMGQPAMQLLAIIGSIFGANQQPRELAWHITDTHDYFVSESSVYRILKAQDLVTSPQFTVLSAADKFQHPTSHVHELWQTDFI
jgi:hypothetical protein